MTAKVEKISRNVFGAIRLQRGLSLIELMIAMALGLVLVGIVIQVFVSQRQSFTASEALARVQENNRFILELTREPTRSTSLQGFCGGNANYVNHINFAAATPPVLGDTRRVVGGWEYTGTGRDDAFTVPATLAPGSADQWDGGPDMGDLPAAVADRALPFSDVLLIRELRLVPQVWPLAPASLDENSLATSATHNIPECAAVLVTNCTRTDVFQHTSTATAQLVKGDAGCAPANNAGNWQFFYDDDAQIYHVISNIYFIGENPNGNPSFYRASYETLGSPEVEELVEGVENLQVLYGYSAPPPAGDGQRVNVWRTADEFVAGTANWDLVISVRMDAIVTSDRPLGGAAAALQFEIGEGSTVTMPSDRRLRQSISSTVALRNRMITQ